MLGFNLALIKDLPPVVMTGGKMIFSLAVIKAWELLLVDVPLVCL
jgi:hypothetical protein